MDFYEGMVARADPADTNSMTQRARWNLEPVHLEWFLRPLPTFLPSLSRQE